MMRAISLTLPALGTHVDSVSLLSCEQRLGQPGSGFLMSEWMLRGGIAWWEGVCISSVIGDCQVALQGPCSSSWLSPSLVIS